MSSKSSNLGLDYAQETVMECFSCGADSARYTVRDQQSGSTYVVCSAGCLLELAESEVELGFGAGLR